VFEKTLILDNSERSLEIKEDVKLDTSDSENFFENKQSKPLKQESDIKDDNKETESKSISNFFSYLIVLIISLFALLILIDTLKTPLINIFPKETIKLQWPIVNVSEIEENELNLPIQVNGRFVDTFKVNRNYDEKKIIDQILLIDKFKQRVKDNPIKKVIHVKDKILNIIF